MPSSTRSLGVNTESCTNEMIFAKLLDLERLLTPVSAHAQWVDGLRHTLARMKIVRDTPRVTNSDIE